MDAKPISLTIVMPAFNEEKSLKSAVKDVSNVFRSTDIDWQIILVDDRSTDNTYNIALGFAREKHIKVIRNRRTMGIGYCFKQGIAISEKEAITWFPADRENDPASLIEHLTLLEKSDIVVPFVSNTHVRSLGRRILSRIYLCIINFLFGTRFKYTNGNVIYRRKIFERVIPKSNSFFFNTECLIKATRLGFFFVQVPVTLNKRLFGHPKALSFKSIKSVIIDFFSLLIEIKILVANIRSKTLIEKDDGVDIYRLANLGNLFSLPLTLSMPFWLNRLKADILHFHLPNPLSILSYFISRPKGKIIVSYHSDIIRQKIFAPLINLFLIRFLKKSEAIIVTSENIIKNSPILKRFKNKCKVIPHGIDISRFNPDREVIKKAEQIRQRYGTPIILFVGRLVYYKGLDFLLRAMRHIDARLLIVGDGPLKNRLKRQARHLGILDKVIWLFQIENEELASYYYACDIFVLPSSSRAESFGIVQLEAFACSRPAVSTDLPTGVPYVNLDGKTGLIVSPRNPQALVYAIDRLLKLPKLRQYYGQNGKKRVEKEFTKEKMAEEVLKVYEEVTK